MPDAKTTKKGKRGTRKRTSNKYIEAVGRRKEATAIVRLYEGQKGSLEFIVNNKKYNEYFPVLDQQKTVIKPLEVINKVDGFKISVLTRGGGLSGQADAVCHGLARALVKYNPDLKPVLKAEGLLTRDPRMVERKKYGLKKARRAPQWSKR